MDNITTYILEQEKTFNTNIQNKIIEWFTNNPYPKDDKVHVFAESMNIDPDEFETQVYAVLCSFLCEGRSKGKDINPDQKELKMGINVEMEHTTNKTLSRKIAMDHLVEIKDYYTRLAKMEKEAGVEH